METRMFGRTGIQLSVLGFGCGAVGGLMVRGDPMDQERTIARAIGAGVNYFDTAVQYGNGESEKNLGRILHQLRPPNAVVGTKVRLPSASFGHLANAVATSLEHGLMRLWSSPSRQLTPIVFEDVAPVVPVRDLHAALEISSTRL